MKFWHISDTHLSMDDNWVPIKPMHLRKWAVGVWTYEGYLEKITKFGQEIIKDEDFVAVTGDIVHDMKPKETENSIRWLRKNIKGTIVICRGNHDKYWKPGQMRQNVSDLPNLYIVDEGEIITIGPYTIGCFSDHKAGTQDFTVYDSRYVETAKRIVEQAKPRDTIPVMLSHYPIPLAGAQAIGKAGVKAYLSGHIHVTAGNDPNAVDGLNWEWYEKSAALTDDKTIDRCFFSTGTTDTVLVKHGQSFKELKVLEVSEKEKQLEVAEEMLILCGIPGSGKSTVAHAFRERYDYVRVNQDDLGSKKTCIKITEAALRNGRSIVIDRCNFDASQRKTWIDLAKMYKVKSVRAIELILPLETCIERAAVREDHPTIKGSMAAENVCKVIAPLYTSPQLSEGIDRIEKIDTLDLIKNLDLVVDMIRNPEKYK